MAKVGARVSGNRELSWTANLDISKAKKSSEELRKTIEKLKKEFDEAYKPKFLEGAKSAQLSLIDSFKESRKTIEGYNAELAELKKKEAEARVSTQEHRRDIQALNLARKQELEAARNNKVVVEAAAGSYLEANKRANELLKTIKAAPGGFASQDAAIMGMIKEYRTLDEQLKAFDVMLGNHQRNVGNYASGFNGLSNSINQITREFPAFTYSMQTGFLALSNNIPIFFDQIKMTNDQIKAMRAEGQKVPGLFSQLVTSIFSWGTALSLGVTLLTVYGKEIGEFITSLFKGSEAIDKAKLQLESMNEALKGSEYGTAVKNVKELTINVDLAKKGFISKKGVIAQYNETMGKTVGIAKNLNEVETLLRKNADAYVKMTLYKAAAQLALEAASKKAYEAEQARLKKESEFVNAGDRGIASLGATGGGAGSMMGVSTFDQSTYDKVLKEEGAKRKKAQIKDAEDAQKVQEDIAKTFQQKAAQIAKNNKLNFFSDNEEEKVKKVGQSAINAQRALQKKIDDNHKEATRKQLTADQEEIQSIKDKYAALQKEVDAYYSNPKNKGRVNTSTLKSDEAREIANAEAQQEIERTKLTIETQKELFDNYEKYKSEVGKTEADKRFAEELKGYKTYVDYLNSLLPDEKDQSALANKMRDLLKGLIPEAKNEQQARQDEEYRELIKSTQSYQESLLRLNEQYEQNKKTLIAKGGFFRLKELEKQYHEEVDKLIDQENAKSDIYKRLAEETLVLTRSEIKNQIDQLTNLLKTVSLPPELKANIEKQLGELQVRLNVGATQSNLDAINAEKADVIAAIALESQKASPDIEELTKRLNELNEAAGKLDPKGTGKVNGLQSFLDDLEGSKGLAEFNKYAGDAANGLNTMAGALQGVNDDAAYTLDTIGQLVGSAADLGVAIASGDPSKMIAAGIQAVGSLFSIGKKVKEMNAAARKEVADFYSQAIAGEREYQDLLKQRALQTVKDNKAALDGIRDEIDLRRQQAAAYREESAEIMAQLQSQEYIQSERYEHGTWFRKAKVIKTFGSLQGMSFEELNKLLLQGKLEGETKRLVERLVELEKQGYDAEQAIKDLAAQTVSLFSGTSTDKLSNDIADMFANGKTSAKDFADYFEETMRTATRNILEQKIASEIMDDFYKEFAKRLEDGNLSDDEIDQSRKDWIEATEKAKKLTEDLERVTGIKVQSPEAASSSNSLMGAAAPLSKEWLKVTTINSKFSKLSK